MCYNEFTGDIYDSAFRTMVNDCSKLMLPLINEMFGEHYTGSEESLTVEFPNSAVLYLRSTSRTPEKKILRC